MSGNFFVAFLVILTQVSAISSNTYRGAVVEYHPTIQANDQETMKANVKNYVSFIELAKKKGAEIVAFPELGLMADISSPIPDPFDRIAPCDNPKFKTTQAVKDLSCASKTAGIYSVVNMLEERTCEAGDRNCPASGFYKLITNVVFDRKGVVIARYPKYNIYGVKEQRMSEPEFSFFDTDFGVRFGTFICFDILFSTPAQRLVKQYRITDFIFTTFWFGELPFLSALQAQRGWAEANNVNLLSSGVNMPNLGSGGSGIYNGKFGHLTQIMPETSMSKLLIADIPKISESEFCPKTTFETSPYFQTLSNSTNDFPGVEETTPVRNLSLLAENLSQYPSEIIKTGEKFQKTICVRSLCCNFDAEVVALNQTAGNYTWRAIVYDGIRKFGVSHFAAIQTCGVVACYGPDLQNCTNRVEDIPNVFRVEEIKIKGNFKLRNSFQMPSTLTDGEKLEPLPAYKYEFLRTEKENSAEVSLELLGPVTNLYVFSIWGRDFSRDGIIPESEGSTVTAVPLLLATLFGFVLFAR